MPSKPITITVTNEIQRIFPPGVRRKAGFKAGDQLEVKASGGVVTLIPKLPTAEDEYTPEARQQIDAQLDEARKTPLHGPFKSGEEIAVYLKKFKASVKPKKTKTSR